MTKNNGTLSYRVGRLEKSQEGFDNKMDQVLTNHLPHINEKLTRLTVLVTINIATVIAAIILSRYL